MTGPLDPKNPIPSDAIDTSTHKLVSKLLGDTAPPYDSAVLIGFFGPSQREDYIRLYVTLDLRSYYEIPKDEVLHTEPVEAGNDNSPSRVLVKNAEGLERKQILVVSPETSYLKGPIVATDGDHYASSEKTTAAFAFAADVERFSCPPPKPGHPKSS